MNPITLKDTTLIYVRGKRIITMSIEAAEKYKLQKLINMKNQ